MGIETAMTATLKTATITAAALTIAEWQADKDASKWRNQPPTIAQGGGGSYIMVDTCSFGRTKNEDKKILESLLPILHPLGFFIVSHQLFCMLSFFHHLTEYIHHHK